MIVGFWVVFSLQSVVVEKVACPVGMEGALVLPVYYIISWENLVSDVAIGLSKLA